MSPQDVDKYERVRSQLTDFYNEISSLSGKKPNDPINLFKLKFINGILIQANEVLGTTYVPFAEFTQFDEVSLPSNSDVVMMLSQYLRALERYEAANTYYDKATKLWKAEKKETPIPVKSRPVMRHNRRR